MVVPAEAVQLLSRGDLRWRIANRLGGSEEWAWRTVADAGAAASYAPVRDLVIGGLNEQRGMWAYFPDGTANKGLERRIVSFQPWQPADPYADPQVPEQPAVIEWASALPEAVAPGHRIDLCVLRPSRINDAIDDALRLMAEPISIPAEVTITTDGTTDTFALPDDAVGVVDLHWLDEAGLVVAGTVVEPWRNLIPRSSWEMVPARSVRVGGVSQFGPLGPSITPPPLGWRLLVEYRAMPALPQTDDDLVQCLPQAVVSTAVADLAMGLTELRTLLPLYIDQAQRDRARASRHDFGSVRPVMP